MPQDWRKELDRLVKAQADGTYIDPLVEARDFLSQQGIGRPGMQSPALAERQGPRVVAGQSSPGDSWDLSATQHLDAIRRMRDEDARVERQHALGTLVGEGANLAMLPLAFMGGPAGLAAGAATTASGLKAFYDEPSRKNAAWAALGLAGPGLSAFRKLRSRGSAPEAIRRAVSKMSGAGDLGAIVNTAEDAAKGYWPVAATTPKSSAWSKVKNAFMAEEPSRTRGRSYEQPYRASGTTSDATGGSAAQAPETMLQRARAQVDELLGRTPQGKEPWRPGDLTTGPMNRVAPEPLPNIPEPPPRNLNFGNQSPLHIGTLDDVLERVFRNRPSYVQSGERIPPSFDVRGVAQNVLTRGVQGGRMFNPADELVSIRKATRGSKARGSKVAGLTNKSQLSEGEQAGINALDDIAERTGSTRPNKYGHGTRPVDTRVERTLESFDETDKRRSMFGGVGTGKKRTGPVTGKDIKAMIARLRGRK